MALFGFGKKNKAAAMPEPPRPPRPPSPPQIRIEMPKLSERHTDDLEKQAPEIEGPLFPEIPRLELPELEPAEEKKSIAASYEKVPEQLPELEDIEVPSEIPEEIPEIETSGFAPRIKKSPLFINVDTYSDMIEQLNVTRAKLNEYASAASRVIEFRTKKDSLMEKWRGSLEDTERKLLAIDRMLFEGGSANA